MKGNSTLSRRHFLQSGGTLSGATLIRLQSPALIAITASACTAKRDSETLRVLGEREAADFSAISARLIPTTDTPGATEAGVVYFIDHAFADVMITQLDSARGGLATFNNRLAAAHPDSRSFADLDPAAQDAFLITQEDGDFFNFMRLMTIFGFFSMERHGGNRGHVGWDLIGFKGHQGAWQHPFGYYDTEPSKEVSNGE